MDILCLEEEVTDLLSLNTFNANGPDGIYYNQRPNFSINPYPQESYHLPTWKTSSIVPIPKSNETFSATNYQLISLLSIVSKFLERHIYWQIATHLEMYSPISLHQWRFQPKKSTTAALLDVCNTWVLEIDKGTEVCAIFFDLKKAFDSVPHKKLIKKVNKSIYPEMDHFLSKQQEVVRDS